MDIAGHKGANVKQIILVLLFTLVSFSNALADPPGYGCLDCAYLYIDMEDYGGYVDIYYVDCDGKSREKTFERETGYVLADTDYSVLLRARPYDDYFFLGWGDDELQGSFIEVYLCDDLFLVPRFQEIDDDDDDDDYSCFIRSCSAFGKD